MPMASKRLAHTTPLVTMLAIVSTMHINLACAENKPINEAAVLKTIDTVMAEQRVFATCFALDPFSRKVVNETWVDMVKASREVLASRKPSIKLIAQFEYKTHPSRLVDDSMSLKDAITFCEKNAEIQKRFFTFGYLNLSLELSKLLN